MSLEPSIPFSLFSLMMCVNALANSSEDCTELFRQRSEVAIVNLLLLVHDVARLFHSSEENGNSCLIGGPVYDEYWGSAPTDFESM